MAEEEEGSATRSKSGSTASRGEETSYERPEVPIGRVVPLNSRRLTAAHLKRIAEALELPVTGATDQLCQLIEGKLESARHKEAANVQVILQEEQRIEMKLSLLDEGGVFLETKPLVQSRSEAESERETLQDALEEANQQNSELMEKLADTTQKLEEEKAETARLTDELSRVPTGHKETAAALEKENKTLKEELRVVKERHKKMWQMTCEQSREQEELLAAQQKEIDRLKARERTRITTPPGPVAPSHSEYAPSEHLSRLSPSPSGHLSEKLPVKRRGKVPPIDPYTGEDPEVRMDDWLPALKRAASWNDWSETETLMQLADHLRGRALQEWNLLSETERSKLEIAVGVLRSRLEQGSKAMAAQEFRHCSQMDSERVADYIRRLEKTFRVAYGREALTQETRNALLYGQLHEGLLYRLMEAPAVSGATDYSSLCLAARSEER